jgi:hypothetical protein
MLHRLPCGRLFAHCSTDLRHETWRDLVGGDGAERLEHRAEVVQLHAAPLAPGEVLIQGRRRASGELALGVLDQPLPQPLTFS